MQMHLICIHPVSCKETASLEKLYLLRGFQTQDGASSSQDVLSLQHLGVLDGGGHSSLWVWPPWAGGPRLFKKAD